MKRYVLAIVLMLVGCGVFAHTLSNLAPGYQVLRLNSNEHASTVDFMLLMKTVADSWNEGNARKAADCFAEEAVYMEPPDRQLYIGRRAVYDFFGGANKPNPPMRMKWHHLAFNEQEQVGYGEYTFQMTGRYHGVVTVLVQNGKIAKWREYQYKSDSDWDAFTGRSKF